MSLKVSTLQNYGIFTMPMPTELFVDLISFLGLLFRSNCQLSTIKCYNAFSPTKAFIEYAKYSPGVQRRFSLCFDWVMPPPQYFR